MENIILPKLNMLKNAWMSMLGGKWGQWSEKS